MADRARTPAPTARERYDAIADDLAARHPEVQAGQMFGMPTIKRDGKAVCGLWGEADMVFKLVDPAAREAALALPGAGLFDPMGGRPMKEWVLVPGAQAGQWAALAGRALAGMSR